MKLRAGVTVSYFDEGPNGGTEINIAIVVRARGLGVLLTNEHGTLFRIPRSDVLRIIPQEKQMATFMTAKPAAAPNHTRGMAVPEKKKRSFVVWGRIGAGVKVNDGTLRVAVGDDVLEALQRRIERDSGLKVAVFSPDGHEVKDGRVVRSDFKVTLGTKCKGGGYNVEGSLWVGLVSQE